MLAYLQESRFSRRSRITITRAHQVLQTKRFLKGWGDIRWNRLFWPRIGDRGDFCEFWAKNSGAKTTHAIFFIPKILESSRAPPETFSRVFRSDHSKALRQSIFDHKWFWIYFGWVTLANFGQKTREPRLLMRFFLFQKIWKIQELLRRHFEGFFDRIMGKPSTEQISTISDFELLQSWNIKIPMKMHVLEWENSWAARKTRFRRFFDLFWSLGRLYNVYKKIFRNILFLFLFP